MSRKKGRVKKTGSKKKPSPWVNLRRRNVCKIKNNLKSVRCDGYGASDINGYIDLLKKKTKVTKTDLDNLKAKINS